MSALVLHQEMTSADFLRQGEFEFITVTDTGLIIKPEMDEDSWLKAVEASLWAYKSTRDSHIKMMFRVGDLLHFGEAKFGERWATSINDTFAAIMSESVMSRAMWVSGKIATEIRREDLTFEHHEAVAKLDPSEQKEFLNKAAVDHWTTKELKEAVRVRHPGKPRVKVSKSGKVPLKVSKKDAMAGAELVVQYFKEQESDDAHGPASKWTDEMKEPWREIMLELNRLSRRLAIPSHGKKGDK